MPRLVEVALPLPLDSTFTYDLPEEFEAVGVGHRVLVPFKHRSITGYVVDLPSEAGSVTTKSIHAVLDDLPILTPELVAMARHMAELYGAPFGECLQTLLPAGLIRQTKRKVLPTAKEGNPEGTDEAAFLDRLRNAKGGLVWTALVAREPKMVRVVRGLEREGWVEVQSVLQSERAKESTRKRKKAKEEGSSPFDTAPAVRLTVDQKRVAERLRTALESGAASTFLLHGITGSGKTEMYLGAAALAVAAGKSVLALVPEIALTPQFVGRFRARFGDRVALLHSARSENERLAEWKRIRRGEATVVIGARSAVFAPLQNLGLLVVDEEHDGSYKQEEGLPYSVRDLAEYRASMEQAVLVLGSATPSMETYSKVERGELELLELPFRVTGHELPQVQVVDLRLETTQPGRKEIFSSVLRDAVADVLTRGEQAVLFLNRRGFAPFVLCPKCGKGLTCKNCSVSLTFHREERAHLCHYCGASEPEDVPCPSCKQDRLVALGFGTEKVEQELHYYFPDARVARMDRDSVKGKGKHEKILSELAEGKIDILIGTQMVTKGLDFPRVSLAGVLIADQSLQFPDFRAAERTFQLLTQVVGRCGRGDRRGLAIIQTFQPEHYAIATASNQDYARFYELELVQRKDAGYPPFGTLVMYELHGKDETAVRQAAIWLGKQARLAAGGSGGAIDILGPAPAPLRRLSGKTRYHLLLRSGDKARLNAFGRWLADQSRDLFLKRRIGLRLDLDPHRFL